MANMNGKVVLITGAKGGLGTFVTNTFLEAGATVAGVSRSVQASDFPSPGFVALPAELSSAAAAEQVVRDLYSRYGRIDTLVHLMGGYSGGATVEATTLDTFDQMIDLNLRSAFYMFRAVLPLMREQGGGCILAVGSRAAVEPAALAGVYSASKAALTALVKSIALENKGNGISANTILPGTMDTPANRKAVPGADYSQWVHPGCVANLLKYMASGAASQMSGAVLPIYGGEL